MLVEAEKRELGGDVACLAVAPVPEGRQRFRFLAAGMFDGTVRVLSLDPDSTLKGLAMQVGAVWPCRGDVCWVRLGRCLGAAVG